MGDFLLGLLLSVFIGGAVFFLLRSNAFRRFSRHQKAAAVEVSPAARLARAGRCWHIPARQAADSDPRTAWAAGPAAGSAADATGLSAAALQALKDMDQATLKEVLGDTELPSWIQVARLCLFTASMHRHAAWGCSTTAATMHPRGW